MFWTNQAGSYSHIGRGGMDGSDITYIVEDYLQEPSGLVIDYSGMYSALHK
jgi:hypothetical protein